MPYISTFGLYLNRILVHSVFGLDRFKQDSGSFSVWFRQDLGSFSVWFRHV